MNTQVHKIILFIKKEIVFFISAIFALFSMIFIPPSIRYLSYLDFRVLSILFCLMAVVAGFNKTGLFLLLSKKLLIRAGNTRSLGFLLIMLCFFTSMWITNDVALITFVPFAIMLLSLTGQTKYLIPILVLQTVAANLGSTLTPIGNPQNLYLYTYFSIPIHNFFMITFPVVMVSFLLLNFSVLFIKKECLNFSIPETKDVTPKQKNLIGFYGILFLLCLGCVLHLIDYRIMFCVVLISILLFDRHVIKRVDYMLLLTFVCFFVFVGNIGCISAVKDFLSELLMKRELIVSLLLSQGISNVPAAVLLSSFTKNYRALILGTDIGGLGTLVASLASLISYKFYSQTEGAKLLKYFAIFTIVNILFLVVLLIIFCI